MKLSLIMARQIISEDFGDLDLRDTGYTELPDGLTVEGDLRLSGKNLKSLPRGLAVKGSLTIQGTGITAIPDDMIVGKSVCLTNVDIPALPAGMSVIDGHVVLNNTAVTSLAGLKRCRSLELANLRGPVALPEGLVIEQSLALDRSAPVALPENLTVGEHIFGLHGSDIKTLPRGLKIGGDLSLACSRIESLPDDMSVNGSLDLSGSRIKELPDNFTAGKRLDLQYTPIRKLPRGLAVDGDLDLRHTGITELPEDLKVSGRIYLPDQMIERTAETHQAGQATGGSGCRKTGSDRGRMAALRLGTEDCLQADPEKSDEPER